MSWIRRRRSFGLVAIVGCREFSVRRQPSWHAFVRPSRPAVGTHTAFFVHQFRYTEAPLGRSELRRIAPGGADQSSPVMASYSLWSTCNRRSRGTPPLPWFVTFETSQKPYATTTCAPSDQQRTHESQKCQKKNGADRRINGLRHAMLLRRDCVGSCLRPREDRTNRRGGYRPCLRPINPPRRVAPGCASPLDRSRRIVQRFVRRSVVKGVPVLSLSPPLSLRPLPASSPRTPSRSPRRSTRTCSQRTPS